MRDIASRKDDHIRVAVFREVEYGRTLLDQVYLLHDSLPEINLEDVDCSVRIFRKDLSIPLIIGALTGGTEIGLKVNKILAEVAEKFRVGICVGSQRIAIEKKDKLAIESFTIVREKAPTTLKIANIGAPQISRLDEKSLLDWCIEAIDMINADAIEIHLNPLQESLQLEGEPTFSNVLDKIRHIAKSLNKPVIVKEVGFGISKETAAKLADAGISGIEIAGLGGTNFTLIEMYRRELNDPEVRSLYETFLNYGIPTVLSVCEVLEVFNGTLIASGGVRSGLDIAKLLAIGADLAAIARPFLEKALLGKDKVESYLKRIRCELLITMFLTGSRTVNELKTKPIVFGNDIICWLRQRKLSKCLKRVNLE